ncbi:DNA-binding transcriptional regulator [Verrucomicrobiaceae bacterium 5K15]|uniref:DNA-binding transcriptional regulator n=1 Tax=Oceaniferula flava TaxID=2800421 RepID=A0AAE2SDK2_9BACT|nr:DNA-binding transcriptional regulator [Oceaniferula flavus]MBK1856235.1 DNA-binding transcriptional regulator [Oceaniferula flavus]MBM1137542.1 DNA-binding transcriptional regulator [Oceaniferula flavus]
MPKPSDKLLAGSPEPRIGVMIETGRSFSRGLIQGIAQYAKEHGPWQIILHEHHREAGVPKWLEDWDGDGLITRVYDPDLADFLAAAPYPVVDIAGSSGHPQIPSVQVDQKLMARSVAEFFLNAAFSSFAFCGYPGLRYSDEHQAAFLQELASRGFSASVYHAPDQRITHDLNQREEFNPEGSPELTEWVLSLPKRTAIFTCTDLRALQLQMCIKNAGKRIPEDISVLGLGDETVMCSLANPELSSVRHDSRTMAKLACHWMQNLIDQEDLAAPVPQNFTITERASTDAIASDDPLLVKAMRFIRANCHKTINAQSVLSHVERSRNTVETRFRNYLGRTVADEILRLRIERARLILTRTNLSIEQTAHSCGFATVAHFTRLFKKETSYTPGSYRSIYTLTQ